MAISNYSELLTAITNWRGGDSRQTARYPEWITLFESWFNRNHRVRQMESLATIPLLGDGFAAIPDDYLAWRSVEWTGPTPARSLEWVHPKKINTGWTAIGDGATTEFFTIQNGAIFTAPLDTNVDGSIFLRYWAKVPALTEAEPDNWLMTEYPDMYLNGVLLEAAKYHKDVNAMATYKGFRKEISDEITGLSRMNQGADAVRSNEYM